MGDMNRRGCLFERREGSMGTRVGSIVLDCRDFPAMMRFWQEALHYEPREPAEAGWVVLRDPRGVGPNLSLNRDTEPAPDGYRIHLDLYSEEPEQEVQRLVSLGAKVDRPRAAGEDFAVLVDPDGNRFCVVDKRGKEGR
jgi:predicted enzyme related to lactoylglutathione lyase